MTIKELILQATDGDIPSPETKKHIMKLYASNENRTLNKSRRAIPAIILAAALICTLSVSAAFVAAGGFERYFGSAAGYATDEPTVISQSDAGDAIVIAYNESWCDGHTLYIGGTVETPKPLDAARTYVFCPRMTINGVKITSYNSTHIYPNGTTSSSFLFDVPLPSDMSDNERLEVTIAIKWLEDWTDNQSGVSFYPEDVALYTGEWTAELSVAVSDDTVSFADLYSDESMSIDSVELRGLSLIIRGSGLDTHQDIWIKKTDGSYIGKSGGDNCSDISANGRVYSDKLIYMTFDKPLEPEEVEAVVVIDDRYTIIGDSNEYYGVVAEIPLNG